MQPPQKAFFVLVLFIISCSFVHADDPLYFIEYGQLFTIDAAAKTMTHVASFHPAAPTVTRAPDGLYWGRIGESYLGAFDPASSQFKTKVRVPFRPYNHVMAPNGKAYITHNTLTPEGFWISIIDTHTHSLKSPIKHISGLRTDLSEHNNFIYLATRDVRQKGILSLHRVSTKTDHLETLYQITRPGYILKISIHENLLYLCYLSIGRDRRPPLIEIFNLESLKVVSGIEKSDLPLVERLIEHMVFTGSSGLIPCIMSDGTYAIVVFNARTHRVEHVMKVSGPVLKIVGVRDRIVMYLDNPMYVGKEGVSLYFYDMEKEAVLKTVNIALFLKAKFK